MFKTTFHKYVFCGIIILNMAQFAGEESSDAQNTTGWELFVLFAHQYPAEPGGADSRRDSVDPPLFAGMVHMVGRFRSRSVDSGTDSLDACDRLGEPVRQYAGSAQGE